MLWFLNTLRPIQIPTLPECRATPNSVTDRETRASDYTIFT